MKILHLASFSGNIGDNASHMGLRKILSELLDFNQINNIEIRDFYKSTSEKYKKYFDETFVDLCNNYDLVIWGGGGYLDYWVPDSKTGSTFDISNRQSGNLQSTELDQKVQSAIRLRFLARHLLYCKG